jgi:predicted enzyme related to lactoylglutathione lyase
MDMKFELVPVPVADIDRAKAFYADQVGFRVDHDTRPTAEVRVVQLTPPGSGCSIALTRGLPAVDNRPGSLRGLHLVVDDIVTARETLVGRGVEVDDIVDLGAALYAGFADPDGNTWTLQEMTG